MTVGRQRTGTMLRLLCAIAMVMLAFGYAAPVASSGGTSGVELADYRLPDGSLPDICLSGQAGDERSPEHHQGWSDCEYCRLTNTLILALPPAAERVPLPLLLAAIFPTKNRVTSHALFSPNTAPRGPPLA